MEVRVQKIANLNSRLTVNAGAFEHVTLLNVVDIDVEPEPLLHSHLLDVILTVSAPIPGTQEDRLFGVCADHDF
jgi:hypothetical protein